MGPNDPLQAGGAGADTRDVFKWRRKDGGVGTADDDSIDVAARLHPYEELFNEAMSMAARFAAERERRERESARASTTVVRRFGRRAS